MEKLDLAKKTTMLAAVRTLLSYIRTSAVFVSLAFAFMKLDKEKPVDGFTIALFVLSAVFLVVGLIDYFVCKRAVRKA